MDRFMTWCQSLEPDWVGFIIWVTTIVIGMVSVIAASIFALALIIMLTGGLAGLGFLAVGGLLACWGIAIFGQPND